MRSMSEKPTRCCAGGSAGCILLTKYGHVLQHDLNFRAWGEVRAPCVGRFGSAKMEARAQISDKIIPPRNLSPVEYAIKLGPPRPSTLIHHHQNGYDPCC